MKDREPYNIKALMIVYNLFQVGSGSMKREFHKRQSSGTRVLMCKGPFIKGVKVLRSKVITVLTPQGHCVLGCCCSSIVLECHGPRVVTTHIQGMLQGLILCILNKKRDFICYFNFNVFSLQTIFSGWMFYESWRYFGLYPGSSQYSWHCQPVN